MPVTYRNPQNPVTYVNAARQPGYNALSGQTQPSDGTPNPLGSFKSTRTLGQVADPNAPEGPPVTKPYLGSEGGPDITNGNTSLRNAPNNVRGTVGPTVDPTTTTPGTTTTTPTPAPPPNPYIAAMAQLGYNPTQFATNDTAANMAKLIGGNVAQTNPFGPVAPPPQNVVLAPNGTAMNAGLMQSAIDLYGLDRAKAMFNAELAYNGGTGINGNLGTDPSINTYKGDQTLHNNPNLPGYATPGYLGGSYVPPQQNNSGQANPNPAVNAPLNPQTNQYGIQTDPLGFTSWAPNGSYQGTGNSFGGYQGSYDPFGQWGFSTRQNQATSGFNPGLLSLLSLLSSGNQARSNNSGMLNALAVLSLLGG